MLQEIQALGNTLSLSLSPIPQRLAHIEEEIKTGKNLNNARIEGEVQAIKALLSAAQETFLQMYE